MNWLYFCVADFCLADFCLADFCLADFCVAEFNENIFTIDIIKLFHDINKAISNRITVGAKKSFENSNIENKNVEDCYVMLNNFMQDTIVFTDEFNEKLQTQKKFLFELKQRILLKSEDFKYFVDDLGLKNQTIIEILFDIDFIDSVNEETNGSIQKTVLEYRYKSSQTSYPFLPWQTKIDMKNILLKPLVQEVFRLSTTLEENLIVKDKLMFTLSSMVDLYPMFIG
jgi:hypothetical protein